MATIYNFNGFKRNNQPAQDNAVDLDEMKRNKRIVRFIVLGVLILIILSFISSAIVVTRMNEYSIVQQFGEIVSVRSKPGLSYRVPVLQTVRSIPNTVLLYDLPISDVITMDKKTMVADSFVLWKITDPTKFIQTLSGSVPNAENRISTIVYNSMKNVISSLSQSDIISGRDKLAGAIFDNIGGSLEQYGVELVAVETKHLDLPDDNKNAVYERMISERNNIAASYQAEGESEAKKIRTETDKTIAIQVSGAQANAEKIMAEGEAEYMRTLSQAYADPERANFYSFVRSLDAAKISLVGDDKTLILSKDSPMAQIFYNEE